MRYNGFNRNDMVRDIPTQGPPEDAAVTDMHQKIFEQIPSPTVSQSALMHELGVAAKAYLDKIEAAVPDGPDRTYLVRKLREVQMWVNATIVRHPDGSPR